MGSEWEEVTLGDIAEKVVTGGTPLTSNKDFYKNATVPWLKTKEVNFGRIYETENYISELGLDKSSAKLIPPNSVIIAMYGQGDTAGRVAVNKIPLATNQACCNLIIQADLADYQFIYYYLKGSYSELVRRKTGSAQPNLNTKILREFEIVLPTLKEQKAIAHILGSLDDKIELNRQMNETLESMAQALFKSWFVDFDPVIDNALAAGNSIPDVFAKRAEQRREMIANAKKASKAGESFKGSENNHQALFPSEFEFTEEMGWIPKGWKVGQFSKHALIEMGQSPKGDTYNSCSDGMPLVNGPVEFGPYFTNKSKWTTSPTKVSQKGDLVVCVRGSTTGRFVKSDGQYCLGRGVCSVRAKRSQCFVDHLFKLSIDQLLVLATGSTFPNWSRKTLTDYTVIIPPQPIIDIFDGLVSPKVERIESGFIESSSLTKIRDALLPKLLSGELRIPDAEKLRS